MERESLEMDVVFVGAGPANLSGALHLARLVAEHNEAIANRTREGKSLGEVQIAVIEKGASIGAHILSGAVMDPRGFPEFPGAEMLYDEHDHVIGVRTGDKGIDKEGRQKDNFEPGVDLLAKITVLGEGVRGSLAKKLIQRLRLDEGREPQVYSVGVKELWQLPDNRYPAGRVTHTLGFPSDQWTYGGGWIYGMQNRILNLGYVTGLDYRDPLIDPHAEFQKFKTHPFVAKLLNGGKMIRYGAKAIAAGGMFAIPRLYADGVLLVGDTAGFLNAARLKGIHSAIKSGMLAAETMLEALVSEDYSARSLAAYEKSVKT